MTAMQQHRHSPYVYPISSFPRRCKNHSYIREPFRVLDQRIPACIGGRSAVANRTEFLVAISHGMNIWNVTELQSCIGIVGSIFITISFRVEQASEIGVLVDPKVLSWQNLPAVLLAMAAERGRKSKIFNPQPGSGTQSLE